MPRAVVPANTVPADTTGSTGPPADAGPPSGEEYCTHPLAASVRAVDRAVSWMSFRFLGPDETAQPPGAGWTGCEQVLHDPAFFSRWRGAVAASLGRQHSEVPERTTAGYVLQWYLSVPSYLGAMLFHAARRVPSLQPPHLAFRIDPGWVEQVALRPGRFWCLPADPAARHPDATVVPDDAVLGTVLRREVVAHAGRFLHVYRPLVRFGRRTLWAAVTDSLDTGLLLAGRSFGSASAAATDARLVLPHRVEPLTSASTICAVTDDHGRTHWTRRRGSCCFYYALPGVDELCATCPRINDAGRTRILGALDQP